MKIIIVGAGEVGFHIARRLSEENQDVVLIDKDYERDLYDRQFSLYIDNIVGRIDLQTEAYGKDENIPGQLFEIYEEQKKALLVLREKHGPIVTPDQLAEEQG